MVGIGLKMYFFYSLLGLSTHKNVTCYPTMIKIRVWAFRLSGSGKSWERVFRWPSGSGTECWLPERPKDPIIRLDTRLY